MTKRILWFLLMALLVATKTESASSAAINVNLANGQSFNRGILGQNGFSYPYLSLNEQGYTEFISLFDRTSIRGVAGGTSANSYNWKTRVEKDQVAVRSDGQLAFGQSTLEFLRLARDHHSELIVTVNDSGIGVFTQDGSLNYTFNYTNTSPSALASLAKDWVRYTNHIVQTYRQGDMISNPDDQRILNEIGWSGPDFNTDKLLAPGEGAVPKVTYWEIGNEVESHFSATDYRSRYRQITQAMLQADSTIKVGPNVIGAANPSQSSALLQELLRNRVGLGRERVDFISYHPYAYQVQNVDSSDHAAVVQTLNSMKSNQITERDWIRTRITNSGRNANQVELLSTEWNPASWEGYEWHERQYNALGVVETAFTYAEMGLRAASFWVWPNDIHTGNERPQFQAFKALVEHAGDTLIHSYSEDNIRLYVSRDSNNGNIAIWGLNFAFGDPTDIAKTLELSLNGLIEPNAQITLMRLANLSGRTTLFSEHWNTPDRSIGWITTDLTGQINLSNFSMMLNPAEITVLLVQVPEPTSALHFIVPFTGFIFGAWGNVRRNW